MSQLFISGHAVLAAGYLAVAIFATGPILRWFGLCMMGLGIFTAFVGLPPEMFS